jgi:low affinity Fe/Cu permease
MEASACWHLVYLRTTLGFMERGQLGARSPHSKAILMPSEVSGRVGFFDRFAGAAADIASRAPFFAFCVLLVLLWLLQGAIAILFGGGLSSFLSSRYQLEINTTTTIITFLMVALLQNSQTRENHASQHKLNAIADALADVMERLAEQNDDDELRTDVKELRLAVGLEERETSADQRRPRKWKGSRRGDRARDD